MFNNLAAYLLGTTSSATTTHPRTPASQLTTTDEQPTTLYRHRNTQHLVQHHQQQQLNSDNQRNTIRLNNSTAVLHVDVSDEEDEDDWVLVDRESAQGDNRDSEGNSTLESSSDEEDSDNEQSPTKIGLLNHHQTSSSITTTDYDITHLLLSPSANTQSPIHTSSSYHLLQPSTYTITTLSSPVSVTASLPSTVNTMEESWFLTPPPCFTSTGPVHMETSPLENLLIEHPSMSVYQNVTVGGVLLGGSGGLNRAVRMNGANVNVETAQGNNSTLAISNSSTKQTTINESTSSQATATVVLLEEVSSDLEDEAAEALLFEVDEEVERGYLCAAQQQQRRRRGNGQRGYSRVSAGEVMRYQQRPDQHIIVEQQGQHGQQGVRNKQAQKVQIHKACQSLKRSYLERNNKAREVNFRNQRLRRGERSQGSTRSNANNNRKCC